MGNSQVSWNDSEAGAVRAPAGPQPARHRPTEGLGLAVVLVLALVLRLWGIGENGWGAEYYSAAVRSMAANANNFLFAAFDPGGFLSVDKPPLALWVQVASVKLFGYAPLSLLVPQAVMGTATVAVLHHLVRRRFGTLAGLLAALFLALTPIAVAVNRSNNLDTGLLLVLMLAAWALIRAAETGGRARLCVALGLVGVAFNVKMLAAFVVLPAFLLVYLAGDWRAWRRRLADFVLAGGVLLALALPWAVFVETTPAEQRPFIGSTHSNSLFELVVGHNAIGRFVMPGRAAQPARGEVAAPPAGERRDAAWSRQFVRTPTGPQRLLDGLLAAQVAWLLPLAAGALLLGSGRGAAGQRRLDLWLWGAWTLSYGVVYSYAGGIIHFYYLSTLGPPLAALAAICLAALWKREDGRRWLFPALLLATAAWQAHVQAGALGMRLDGLFDADGDWRALLPWALAAGVGVAVAGWLAAWRERARWRGAAAGFGVAALLALPLAWAMSAVLRPAPGMVPSADLLRFDAPRGGGRRIDIDRLAAFLLARREDGMALLATTTTQLAAPLIIRTGEPVLAMGGFHGVDPAMTPERLAHLVATRRLRFVLLGDASIVSRRMGSEAAGRAVADWVRAHGRSVAPQDWGGRGGGAVLYDLQAGPGDAHAAGIAEQGAAA